MGTGRKYTQRAFWLSMISMSCNWNAPNHLHTACGNHAQKLSIGIPAKEEIAVKGTDLKSGPPHQVCQLYDKDVVMRPIPRVSRRADGWRSQARKGSVQ